MRGASKNGNLQEEKNERAMSDKHYIPDPFPKDQFESLKWSHVLAKLDVRTIKVAQTQFCEKEYYDIAPL